MEFTTSKRTPLSSMLRINYGKSCGGKGAMRLGKGGHKLSSREASSEGIEIGTPFFHGSCG